MLYVNTKGSDTTGRYVPYWFRADGKIDLDALIAYETPGEGDYYLLARDSGNETIIDPYPYDIGGKSVLITSVVVPIRIDGAVVAVAGVDIALSALQEMIQQIRPYDTGYRSEEHTSELQSL